MRTALILTAFSVEYKAVRSFIADWREEVHPQGTELSKFGRQTEQLCFSLVPSQLHFPFRHYQWWWRAIDALVAGSGRPHTDHEAS